MFIKSYFNQSLIYIFTLDSSGVNSEATVKETTIRETKSMPIIQAITPISLPKWVDGYPSPKPTKN